MLMTIADSGQTWVGKGSLRTIGGTLALAHASIRMSLIANDWAGAIELPESHGLLTGCGYHLVLSDRRAGSIVITQIANGTAHFEGMDHLK